MDGIATVIVYAAKREQKVMGGIATGIVCF
jgi:hypothetical protein